MIRHKVSYFLSIAVVLVLLFFFPKPILLAVLLLEIALPLLALILLRMDIAAMTLSLQAPVTSNVNAPLALDIAYKAKRPLFSVSAVEMTLEMQNLLFHTQEERWLRIGLSSRKSSHVEFTPDMCGEWFIRASGVQCLDVFGFCAAAVPCELFCRVKVMPEQNDITIMTDQASRAKPEVGSFRVYQKGNDTAEVFELREYQEGDELKAIHWKLTSKMDRLIVREYSDSTRYDTIVLYDIALKANGEDVDKTLLSTSIGAVESLSRALVRAGIPHMAAFVFQSRIISAPIAAEADAAAFLYTLLSYPLAENSGIACQFFLAGQIQQNYESMVYFTIHSFPKELALIPADVNLDAVVVTDKDGVPVVTQPARAKVLVEVPVTYLRKNRSFRIIL